MCQYTSGILCRAYDDLTETYDLCQSRWINSGLYITDDGWQTVKAAIGKYIYVNPETSCQGLFIKKISNSIICCTMLVVYVIWLYN